MPPGMAYSPAVPHRLMAPQFLQKIERVLREHDKTLFHSEKRCTSLDIQEKIFVLAYDHGKQEKIITHLPGVGVPAVYANLGVSSYTYYNLALYAVAEGMRQ